MNPTPNNGLLRLRQLIAVGSVLVVLAIAYTVFTTLHTLHTTGEVYIATFADDAGISVSQNNKAATSVGTGSAHLRLQPGEYQVVASSGGQSGAAIVNVQLDKIIRVKITQNTHSAPSPDSITFTGLPALTANGLTDEQVTNLRYLFFIYKNDAQTIAIDSNSVEPGDHDPASSDPTLSLTFTGTIDSVPFNAIVSYVDLSNVQLKIYDSLGNPLFSNDSATALGN